MRDVKDGGKTEKKKLLGVMLLVTLMLAGCYIATKDQTKNVSSTLPVQRVPLENPDEPEATTGSALPDATAKPSGAPETAKTSEFLDYRSTLANTRSQAATLLDEVITDASASAETVSQALKRKTELADTIAMETEMETLLKARGFSDVLCTISPQSINIVVQCESLTQQQASQIMDIAVSLTGQPASHVRIIPSE